MDFNIPYQLANEPAVVQVLDFDPMEYESYGDPMQITVIELQNVSYNEMFIEMTDTPNDNQVPRDVIPKIPSYGSFVRDLNRCETEAFESRANSTTIENFNRNDMCVLDVNIECPYDCNCEACLQVYFNADISDFDCAVHVAVPGDVENVFYVENVANINLVYDFTRVWNEEELTEYMEFPYEAVRTSTSESFELLLRNNTTLMKSNREEDVTAEAAGFYDSSAINSIIDV